MRKIGIIVADDGEFMPFVSKIENAEEFDYFGRAGYTFKIADNSVIALHSGIGKVNATAAAMYLYTKGCDTILNFGYSGGISKVKKGSVVIADKFVEHDFDLTCLGYKPCEKPGQEYVYSADDSIIKLFQQIYPFAVTGLAVSGDCFVSNDTLRDDLKNNFGAVSCDMETAAIASVCYQTGMRFGSVRQISDDAGDDANQSYKEEAYSGNIVLCDAILEVISKLK